MTSKREALRAKNGENIKRNIAPQMSTTAVDAAVNDIEMTPKKKKETSRSEDVANLDIKIVPGHKKTRTVRKSLYLTDEAAEKLKKTSEEYGLSENELVNQLLMQL